MKKAFLKNMSRTSGLLALFVLTAVLFSGCDTLETKPPFTPLPPDPDNFPGSSSEDTFRFSKDDIVRVNFSGGPEQLQPHEEHIKEDGNITLPLIGTVKAEGKTPGELQTEIHDRYVPSQYLRLTVTVSSDRRVYYVQGQVRSSGRQEYLGPITVTKAIASAGDFTDFADRKKVVLTRSDGKRYIINCIKAARDATLDLPVFPGDKIEVPQRIW